MPPEKFFTCRPAASVRPNASSSSPARAPGAAPRVAEQPGEQDQVLPSGEILVDRGELAGQAHPRTHRIGLAHHIVPEHARRATVRSEQGRQHPDRRRLAGAVRAQDAVHLTPGTVRSTPSTATVFPNRRTRPSVRIAGPCCAKVLSLFILLIPAHFYDPFSATCEFDWKVATIFSTGCIALVNALPSCGCGLGACLATAYGLPLSPSLDPSEVNERRVWAARSGLVSTLM